ncbi:MAG: T9SS type A sorting domain-containing protein [Lewinella sp.]|nr:T9SS type A sorting domain-containing protein [Lewinella sp.]
MKNVFTLVCLLFTLLGPSHIRAQDVVPYQTRKETVAPDCVDVIAVNIPKPFAGQLFQIGGTPYGVSDNYGANILNRDCLPEQRITVEFLLTGQCEPYEGIYHRIKYFVDVHFNGESVVIPYELTDPNNPNPLFFEINWAALGLDNLPEVPEVYDLDVKLKTVTYSYPNYFPVPTYSLLHREKILIVENGSAVRREYQDNESIAEICDVDNLGELDDWTVVCSGQGPRTITSTVSNVMTSTISNSFSASFNAAINVAGEGTFYGIITLGASLSSGVGYEFEFTEENIQSIINSNSQPITIHPPSSPAEEPCNYAGLLVRGFETGVRIYTVSCNSLVLSANSSSVFRPTSISLMECVHNDNIGHDCFPSELMFQIQFDGQDRPVAGQVASTDACLATVSVVQEPAPDYFQSFVWHGPNDFFAVGSEIADVPYGTYTLEITNECGEQSTHEVVVCPNGTTVGPWTFDEATGQVCRTVTCDGGADCEGFSTTECVTPTFGEWTYDGEETLCRTITCEECEDFPADLEQCVTATFSEWDYTDDGFTLECYRTVLANGEPTEFTQTSEPLVTYEYDEFWDMCYRYIRCGASDTFGDITAVEEKEPTYSDWAYEDWDGRCFREVYCFNESGEEVEHESGFSENWEDENDDPTIDWTYDDWDGCVGRVYCDEFDFIGSDFDVDVNLEGEPVFDWHTEINGFQCVAEISCDYNFELHPTDDEISQDAELDFTSGPYYDVFEGCYVCDVELSCDWGSYAQTYQLGPFWNYDTRQNEDDETECLIYCGSISLWVPCSDYCEYPWRDGEGGPAADALMPGAALATPGQVTVKPNPVLDNLQVAFSPEFELGNSILIVTDSQGQVVLRQLVEAGTTTLDLSLEGRPTGVYFLQLADEESRLYFSQKVIKVR